MFRLDSIHYTTTGVSSSMRVLTSRGETVVRDIVAAGRVSGATDAIMSIVPSVGVVVKL